ncbi:M28 family metallopeptidase [Spongiimicrobium salis]|uniref:M28 family metallopeptidase n=1 Tax=Spongiimicrobium salis TaxID=1667022 RepID=UPI00374CD5E2
MRSTLFYVVLLLLLVQCAEKEPIANSTADYFDLIRAEFKGETAYETTAFVEQFWRVVGNDGFNKSIYTIETKLKEAGYVLESNAAPANRLIYRIEKRALKNPTWEPVDGKLSILGQETPLLEFASNRNMIYLNSPSTPKEGVQAEVVFLENPEAIDVLDVKGKIVFAEFGARSIYRKSMAKGALGLMTYNNPSYLQPEKNTTSIQFRAFPYAKDATFWGIALSYAAKEKLKEALSKGSVTAAVQLHTKSYISEELTIIAEVKGSALPEQRLVFSAHVQEPGANDNATGVGTQLEMAQITAQLLQTGKIDAKRSLTFLWGDEIISTRRYIQEDSLRASQIKWGISLDMVGENTALTGGSFLIEKMPDPSAIWTRGKDKHSEWGGDVMSLEDMKPHYLNDFIIQNLKNQGEYARWEVNTNPFEGGSDHTPFLDANIPGLLLWHFTDQFYHTDNDRLDKVSKATMVNVGTGALASALTLINADSESALNILELLEEQASTRLKTEFDLSLAAVSNGNMVANEMKILEAWTDWYKKSFATIKDMEVLPTAVLDDAILKAEGKLESEVQQFYIKLQN